MKRFFFFVFSFLFLFLTVRDVFAQTFPKPTGYVNDYANLYSPQFKSDLENSLKDFEASTSAEIVVVTIKTLEGMTIDDYSVRLFEEWKIGKEKADNGVLLLIAKDEREVRIEVGYGLEGTINDARAGRIIRDDIVPEFKKQNYEAGTSLGVGTIISYIQGEPIAEAQPAVSSWDWLFDFIPFFLFALVYLGSFLARSKEYYLGGIIGVIIGLIVGMLMGQVIAVFFLMVVLGIIGLLLDFVLSKNYQYLRSQSKSTDWIHSRGGFGGGSSGGFGGFGGGSSGGGGASGKW